MYISDKRRIAKMVTIGADPEVILFMNNRYTGYNGMIPAGIILNKLKDIGSPLTNCDLKGYPAIKTDSGIIFADGASWELNPNAGTAKEVTANIGSLLRTTADATDSLSDSVITISTKITPSVFFNLEMLALWNDPALAEFGCDRDESIWPRESEPSEIDAATHSQRYFGGHIHIGLGDNPATFYEDITNVRRMIALADGILGIASIVYDATTGLAATCRRRVYGQPGVYRLQPHGIEYRTPSNSWLLTKRRTDNMLTLAEHLPILFNTDLPDQILSDERRLMRTLLNKYKMSVTINYLRDNLKDTPAHIQSIPDYLSDVLRGTYSLDCLEDERRGWKKGWMI